MKGKVTVLQKYDPMLILCIVVGIDNSRVPIPFGYVQGTTVEPMNAIFGQLRLFLHNGTISGV